MLQATVIRGEEPSIMAISETIVRRVVAGFTVSR